MTDQPSDAAIPQQLEQLQQRLAQAQRLTALGELLSTTTHEFNNILMTVINYAKLGLRHTDNETRQKAFEKILAAAQRAARISHSILGMAKNRSGNLEPTNLVQLLEDTLLLLERELNKYRIAVEKYLQPIPPVLANGNQIQQVLLNLIINARQAMPQGGRLTVKLWHDPGSGMVHLMIRDTGCGIPPEILPRIFDPFFTTKTGPDSSGKGGTGLGLSMCKEIIQAHQGRIRVESAPGRGTAFTLMLPSAQPPAEPAPPALSPSTQEAVSSPLSTAPPAPAG
ncbi:MAG TPA: ATP-binding protein [Thermoguttaceae bacterium]|jgi:signal transduction histidine kinase|nr:ATP-binding protein [Thermoguttaceae bacterium]HPP52946.1 ATP-binding protein [Thermoguttaceae bacterium]